MAYWDAIVQVARSSSAFNIDCYQRENNDIVKTLTHFNLFIDRPLKDKKMNHQVRVGFRVSLALEIYTQMSLISVFMSNRL